MTPSIQIRRFSNIAVVILLLVGLNWLSQWVTGVPIIGCFLGGVLMALQPVVSFLLLLLVGYLAFVYFTGGLVAVIRTVFTSFWLYAPFAIAVHFFGSTAQCA